MSSPSTTSALDPSALPGIPLFPGEKIHVSHCVLYNNLLTQASLSTHRILLQQPNKGLIAVPVEYVTSHNVSTDKTPQILMKINYSVNKDSQARNVILTFSIENNGNMNKDKETAKEERNIWKQLLTAMITSN